MAESTALLRLEIEASGKRIHKAGFRSAAEDAAADAGITGTVENLSSMDSTGRKVRSARIICEGTKEEILGFIRILNGKNLFFVLDKIPEEEISRAKPIPEREFSEFQIVRGENETPERLDEAAIYMRQSYNEMHGLKNETGALRSESKENFSQLNSGVSSLNSESKKGLSGLKDEVSSLKSETGGNFSKMEKKYHTISNNLDLFVGILAEYVKATKPELKPNIEKLQKEHKLSGQQSS